MQVENNQITYCTNIHKGESWKAHFEELKKHVPAIRQQLVPNAAFGLGLRLSAQAARELQEETNLKECTAWLKEQNIYISTMNGFPYGEFHDTAVKDKVHYPDWTSKKRVEYTQNLFEVLDKLTPAQTEAGISTSPLSYRHWHQGTDFPQMLGKATAHILEVAAFLWKKKEKEGKYFHLDIEPEPDGVLETADEFIDWYLNFLIPRGIAFFAAQYGLKADAAEALIKRHICICYDICHMAVGYENQAKTIQELRKHHIQIGKVQVSAALKIRLKNHSAEEKKNIQAMLEKFNEPVYLHQVIARLDSGVLKRYKDLPEALPDLLSEEHEEWRSHFHVPIFTENIAGLESTQSDILDLLELHKKQAVSSLFEVETYTWEVLPKDMQLPIAESIIRELHWLTSNLT